MNDMAARCGIYCGECEYKDKFNCSGCRKSNGKILWGVCPVAACSIAKGIDTCGDCSEFPCALLNQFAFDSEQGDNGKRIENLKAWKEQGFENWVKTINN